MEVLLFSAGMDSYIAWEILKRPQTLYVNLNHKYANQELNRVKNLVPSTIIHDLDLSQFEKDDAEIPLRNLYLCMRAANLGYDKIWLIVQKDEMSIPDRKMKFFKHTEKLLSNLMEKDIEIDTPFKKMDKTEMVEKYVKGGFDIEKLKQTWACYYPEKDNPCGNCPACFRRFVAMKLNNIHEDWHDKIYNSQIAETYRNKALSKYYSSRRNKKILEALNEETNSNFVNSNQRTQ